MGWDQLAPAIICNHQIFLDTEQYIANWVGKPAGVLFNSGFQMNSSIFRY